MKKIIYFLIVIVIAIGFYKFLSTPSKSSNIETPTLNSPTSENLENTDKPSLIFYWGDGCPHCENVKDFIIANNIDNQVNIIQKEVYKDINNQQELKDTVNQYCPQLNNGGIGVPLALDVANKKCLQGDTPIIEFLQQQIK